MPETVLGTLLRGLPRPYRVPENPVEACQAILGESGRCASTWAGSGCAGEAAGAARAGSRRASQEAVAPQEPAPRHDPPALALACIIERARRAGPVAGLESLFIEALSRLIRDALGEARPDPAFQALVLRHTAAPVREYASLSAAAAADRRAVCSAVDAVAHPGKLRAGAGAGGYDRLARLHGLARAGAWSELAQALAGMPASGPARDASDALDNRDARDRAVSSALAALKDHAALRRLLRLEQALDDPGVGQYRALLARAGPPSGSSQASRAAQAARHRGSVAEADAAAALRRLAQHAQDCAQPPVRYRLVTGLQIPAALARGRKGAKSEWDAVLLRESGTQEGGGDAVPPHESDTGEGGNALRLRESRTYQEGDATVWDVCLLAEVKASPEAASTDFPRLMGGLRLFGQADCGRAYPCQTAEGRVLLRGASLRALRPEAIDLDAAVLYCCDAPPDPQPRLLSAASRMQLLSAPGSLDYAGAVASGAAADPASLAGVWRDLLQAPRWRPVLQQYATLHQVRTLMVNIEDLRAAAP